MTWVLTLHLFATLALVGLVWQVQIVQYPLFAAVGPDAFRRYHSAHCRRIAFVVAPLMLLELGSGVGLLLDPGSAVPPAPALGGAALIGVIWVATALWQVPKHQRLRLGFDSQAHRQLVRSNWIRTAAWTARGGLVLWMANHATR